MSRTVPAAIRSAALASRTNEVTLAFLDITHADLAAELNFVNNTVAVVKGGKTYSPVSFKIILPSEKEGEDGTAQLSVCGVDQTIIIAIRSINSAVKINLTVALASAPDTTEVEFGDFLWRPVTWQMRTASGELSYEDVLDIMFPGDIFSPVNVPGNF
jgi:hypothetical protein